MIVNRQAAARPVKEGRSVRPTQAARTVPRTVCQSMPEDASRRGMLLAGVATVASPLIAVKGANAAIKYLEVDNLSSFQRSDQRNEFAARAINVMSEILTAEDAEDCLRLAMHDAGTYDYATKTGGFDGSIATNSEELGRPENASLKSIVSKLAEAKKKIDAGDTAGSGPISWADTIYLAGRVTTKAKWYKLKTEGVTGSFVATQFANPWPIQLGRLDSSEPGPNRVPAPDADVETIRQFLLKLGAKPDAGSGPFSPKAPFWERPGFLMWTATAADPAAEEARFAAAVPDAFAGVKRSYDSSRLTVTRTDYEVDFAETYNKLCNLGAKFNPNAYLYKIPVQAIA